MLYSIYHMLFKLFYHVCRASVNILSNIWDIVLEVNRLSYQNL